MTGQAIAMPAAADGAAEDFSRRLGTLFDTHHQRLFRLARRLSGSSEDARDVVQETFLRAARSPGSVPVGAPNEEAWLVRVLINICRDRWRRLAVQRNTAASGELDVPDGVRAAAVRAVEAAILDQRDLGAGISQHMIARGIDRAVEPGGLRVVHRLDGMCANPT